MPSIKIYPPNQLPDRGVSETQFSIWKEEMEVYLSQEKDFKVFLPGKTYHTWVAAESDNDRINELADADQAGENEDADEKLEHRRDSLRTVLSIIGKCVSEGHYNSVIRHSTSLTWIYNMLKADYNIQNKGIHFFNIIECKFDSSKHTAVAFYNCYRTLILNNLAKQNDRIKYKNTVLTEDEKMSPMLEDLVLLMVIQEIDPRLPAFIKTHYNHKMKADERFMDFKSDVLVNIPSFLEMIDNTEQNNSIKVTSLNAFRQNQRKPKSNFIKKQSAAAQGPPLYCRMCWLANLPKEIYTSHNLGDAKCTELSFKDRARLKETVQLHSIRESEEDKDENEVAEMFGYSTSLADENNSVTEEVKSNSHIQSRNYSPRIESTFAYIKPVHSQILTVFQDHHNKNPLHIDLDSGADINYCLKSECDNRGFTIIPKPPQISKLGDGVSHIKTVGEINETFYRNNITVTFKAAVCTKLTSPFIGGTVFMKENGIEQDFVRNVIHLHNRSTTVQSTDRVSLLPTAPLCQDASVKVNRNTSSRLLKLQSRSLLPNQEIEVEVPEKMKYQSHVAVQPWEHNEVQDWPECSVKTVIDGKIKLTNSTNKSFLLGEGWKGDNVKKCQLFSVTNNYDQDNSFYKFNSSLSNIKSESTDNTNLIPTDHIESHDVKKIIEDGHKLFKDVFNKDLSTGYNGFYGKHECSLNWATSERPTASKVHVPNYDHDLKVLQQELMDELTRQNVLAIPQEENIQVQAVCPSFVQRKQRARDKSKQELKKEDLRLLINFGPINDKLKPMPNHVPKTNDMLIKLGRWKHIICIDLYNGYFQVKMKSDAVPWLGLQTPFGGMRVIKRSGQGLLGMAEEFSELTSKILKQEMMEGICDAIVDDIYIGGQTQMEAAINYVRVLARFNNANIKITPEKVHIFPTKVDVLGWVWKPGGHLEPSGHRKLALTNTRVEDIKTNQDMRSWVGLFKTLHIATPKITVILSPFEAATAGKESKDKFEWTFDLETKFRDAKMNINSLVTLYLPSPDDQLVLEVDAAKGGGDSPAGIGHALYAVKDGVKKIVRLHSTKLPDKCQRWSPCELEAVAFAAAIDKEYDIIRESKHPLIITPDSKPVHEAVNLINQGKFSTSARMSSFLTNVNRTKIQSKHISGKAKLNPISDLQSRIPSDCDSEICSIHKFIEERIDAVIDPGAKNCKISVANDVSLNRVSWRTAQQSNQACSVAKQLLTSGKTPPKAVGKTSGEYWNDVRAYCREASVSKDGTLIVKSQPDVLSGNIPRERVVVPKPLIPALLYHMHNHNDKHPVKSQQKTLFNRQYFAIHLDKHLDLLYKNCYKCSITQKLPQQTVANESKTIVQGPHTHFHGDVIKRASQNILTVRDHFSSFQDATIINTEQAKDLKEGLISLTSAMRRPDQIYISVDNSPGFKSLLLGGDETLKKLKITLVKTDEINKNSNAVIDKGCQELEEEIKRLEPEGRKIDCSTLKLAVMNLNSRMRRKGTISAFEINSARDQNTGDNLKLDDHHLRQEQLKTRRDKIEIPAAEVEVGDTVRIKNKVDKHKANETFIVTSKDQNKVQIQKLLHPLSSAPAKIMSKAYTTDQKHLVTIHRSEFPQHDDEDDTLETNIQPTSPNPWKPVNAKFFQRDSDDEDDNENNIQVNYQLQRNQVDQIHNVDSEELSWDSSPEQFALAEEEGYDVDISFERSLEPKQLFTATDQSSSSSEVFINEDFQTPPTLPRLKRRNAMRKKKKSKSEPRLPRGIVTRTKLNPERRSVTQPNSPNSVDLDRRQNLENVLRPTHPLVPDNVNVELVQNLETALPLRNLRNKPKVDYYKLHHGLD